MKYNRPMAEPTLKDVMKTLSALGAKMTALDARVDANHAEVKADIADSSPMSRASRQRSLLIAPKRRPTCAAAAVTQLPSL